VLVPVLVFVIAIGLLGSDGAADSPSPVASASSDTGADTQPNGASGAAGKTKPQVQVPKGPAPTTLETKDLITGTGPEAKAGDEVEVHYVVLLYKGGKEVDSSWEGNKPFSFELGSGGVTKGWEQGIEGMKAGGRRELVAPGNLSYGKKGRPPTIGPNETLVSVIDLLAIK
jgi:peptidylprolyl isomerase